MADMLADRELTLLGAHGDLTPEGLRRELDAIGPHLRRVPRSTWEEYLKRVEMHPVAGTEPVELETTVPLWTDEGPASRRARVRLLPTGADPLYVARVTGFEDALPLTESFVRQADGRASVAVSDLQPSPGENPVPPRWRPALRAVVHRLVIGDYDGLERDGVIFDVDVPGQDMVKHWIEQQPESLVDLPEAAWDWSNHTPAWHGPGVYTVNVSMWTATQGLSLLMLEGEVFDNGGDDIRVQVYSVTIP
uniref:DUF7668 domain-containing protein n=1 Tax=Ornithinimicrobium pekingense TaxID=384677 RepID=UPI0012EC1A57|nr:hypothetical protein [Ornithinimicrobium pekingense]